MSEIKENKEVYFVSKYEDNTEERILLNLKTGLVESKSDRNLVGFYFEGNIEMLQNLDTLYLYYNGLKYLPDFNNLTNLKHLFIMKSKIEKFSDGKNKSEGLPIQNSSIENFIEGSGEELDNKNNDKIKADEIIIKSETLEELYIEYNNLHDIPFFDTPNLECLFLKNSHISNVGEKLKLLKKLKVLDIQDSSIEVLDCINLPDSLEEIYIGGYQIFKHFKNIEHLKNLKTVLIGTGNFSKKTKRDYNIPEHVGFDFDYCMSYCDSRDSSDSGNKFYDFGSWYY